MMSHEAARQIKNDDTVCQRPEHDLRESETRYRRLFESAKDGILILDAGSGDIVDVNPFLVDLLGFSREHFLGRKLWEIGPFSDIAPSESAFWELKARGYVRYDHLPLQASDGRRVEVEFVSNLYSEGASKVIQCNIRDITERRHLEEQAAQEREFSETVFNNTGEGILLTDSVTRQVIVGNRAFCDLLGYTPEELATLAIADLHPPESLPAIEAAFARQAAGERSLGEAVPVKRKDGSIFQADIVGTSLVHDGRRVFLGSFRDVTETRRLRASLAQTDRLASMGTLAAGVAHEINNPLTYVLYQLESLADDIPRHASQIARVREVLASRLGEAGLRELLGSEIEALDAAVFSSIEERFKDALNGSLRIKEIARGLGSFSRVEKDRLAPVDLRYPIEAAINIAWNEIQCRAQLVKDFATGSPVMASEGRLAQVFLNLLINATHAITDGDVESNKISVRTWQEGDEIVAEVKDTGGGVSREHLDQIFEPFFTTKPVGVGTGLGLSIVKSIVVGYGGTIDAESELGKGTRFVIRLPVATSARVAEVVPSGEAPVEGGGGRVLVIDDEREIRGVLKRILRRHEVVEAESGEEAREILSRDQSFDVILCDMMMPRLSGVDLHRWLLEHHPPLARKLVFMTGGAFTPCSSGYLEQVSNLRIDKPFDPTNLRKMVAEWVARARG